MQRAEVSACHCCHCHCHPCFHSHIPSNLAAITTTTVYSPTRTPDNHAGTYHPLQPYAHADVPMSDLTEIITPRKVQRDRDTFGDPRPSTQAQDRTLSAILEPSPPIARYSSGHDHFVHQSLTQHALSPAREGHKSEFGVSELLRRLQLQEAEANQLRQQLRRAEAEIDQLYTEAEEVIQENSSLRSDAELRERELRALRESCQELQREKREKPPLARQSNGQVTTDFLVAYVLGSLRSLVLPPNLTSGHPNLDPNDCAPSLEALEEELNRIRRAFGYLLLCTQSGGPVEYAESNASVFADTNSLPRDADSAAASPALRHRSDSPDVNNQLKSLYADSVHLRETDRRHVVTKYFQDEHPLREITIRLTERFTDASDSGSERGVTPVENP
eukprot:TRINITY_DN28159_c0_g1_i1.p1 TRINITY_DN28159_c0_g1~~TRINITY_DN28159_c0_g1_i1.p1  ORF type:complete len:389 (+),score=52.25 TRINITY_DN28159_c0_g1_i1:448-1614(+)